MQNNRNLGARNKIYRQKYNEIKQIIMHVVLGSIVHRQIKFLFFIYLFLSVRFIFITTTFSSRPR